MNDKMTHTWTHKKLKLNFIPASSLKSDEDEQKSNLVKSIHPAYLRDAKPSMSLSICIFLKLKYEHCSRKKKLTLAVLKEKFFSFNIPHSSIGGQCIFSLSVLSILNWHPSEL